MADALALGASVHDVGVQVPSSAPQRKQVQQGTCFFCCLNKSNLKGLELERKKNSGHPLFLAADRSILQSIKIELWHTCFAKCKNSNPHISTTQKGRHKKCLLFLRYSMKWGFERERPENSGHPLFLATDRSIFQSTKFEFIVLLLWKILEFESLTARQKKR